MVNPIYIILVCIITMGLTLCILNLYMRLTSVPTKRQVAVMNRKIIECNESGWMVLIDTKSRVVGLYNRQVAVSHAKIHIGKDAMELVKQGAFEFVVGDFRKFDIEIPRFSYRALYEYQVPHETPVLVY